MTDTPTDERLTPLQRALLAIRELRAELDEVHRARTEPIAITGIGCRLPGGADDPESFWRLLHDGADVIREMPGDRWDVDAYFDPDPEAPGRMNTRWGGFVDGIDRFDAGFFGISPWEAANMDPQQRLMLEVAQEAFDDAGVVREKLTGSRTGVFVGLAHSEYGWLNFSDPGLSNVYTATGSFGAIVANRLSYVYDLRGPSYTMDAVCSSSLLAVHQACESLRAGDCTMALAGGAGLFLKPEGFVWFSKLGVMSPEGRCRAFDAKGNGIVLGEGVAAVVLKTLSRAQADGDPIYAVLRGSAVAQDGRSNGLTAPSRLSQEAMLREAYERAGVDPRDVQYVEAHGTGTILGDPIEAQALSTTLGAGRDPARPLRIGSVKTNIGHLQMVGGLAGLIKVALAMKHRELPPSLHYDTPNPHIPFADYRLAVQDELGPWPGEGPLLAGVTSLSFGGTNVHVVVEEAPAEDVPAREPAGDRARLLPLSANDEPALRDLALAYRDHLADPAVDLDDLCATASLRRTHHDERLTVAFTTRAELAERLTAFGAGELAPGAAAAGKEAHERRRLAFVFPGQGGQWTGMGRRLAEQEPVFRAALEECAQAMAPHVAWSLLDVLLDPAHEALLDRVDVVQPVTFAVQVALAALWRSWGVVPDAVVGHSMGEVAAACVAGALTLDDAAQVICRRSLLLPRVGGLGTMAAVELPMARAAEAIAGHEDRIAIAVSNSPTSTVISGDTAAIEQVLGELDARGVFCRRIKVEFASHSPQVDVLRDDLVAALHDLAPRESAVPIYSTVTGHPITGKEMTADYWARNLREPVLFGAAVGELAGTGHTLFIEISPHPILLPPVHQTTQAAGTPSVALPSLRRDEDERTVLLTTLGTLHTIGHRVDWAAQHPEPHRVLRLPGYRWQRQRHWLDFTPTTPVDPASRVPSQRTPEPTGERPAPAATETVVPNGRDALLAIEPDRRRDVLTTYLREQVAGALGVGTRQLGVATPLTALGLNSLMVFELRNRLRVMYGTQLSPEEFIAGIAVTGIVDAVLAQLDTAAPARQARTTPRAPAPADVTATASTDPADWFVRPPAPDARLRLFCLPFAGGNAALYRTWPGEVPADVDVCALQLPGREERHQEPPFTRMSSLVAALADVVTGHLDVPWAVFGHSLGGLVGYELVRRLRRDGHPAPAHLYVSAARAPQLPDLTAPLHRLPEAKLVEKVRSIGGTPDAMLDDPATLALYLPVLRADFAVVETYVHQSEAPLDCPLTAFSGAADDKVPAADVEPWRDRTTGEFTHHTVPGDHFFVQRDRAGLLAALTTHLERDLNL